MKSPKLLLNTLVCIAISFGLISCGGGGGGGGGGLQDPDDPISEIEPNDGFHEDDAHTISPPVIVSGSVAYSDSGGPYDDFDVFKFIPDATTTYTVTLSGFGSRDLDLYGGTWDGSELYWSNIDAPEEGATEFFTYEFSAGITYYITVEAWDTAGVTTNYLLTIAEADL